MTVHQNALFAYIDGWYNTERIQPGWAGAHPTSTKPPGLLTTSSPGNRPCRARPGCRQVADTPGCRGNLNIRHTGNLLAAQTGVSTKDLMARMGHDDMRAALIYQRATSKADSEIADRLAQLVNHHQGSARHDESEDESGGGAAGVPVPVS